MQDVPAAVGMIFWEGPQGRCLLYLRRGGSAPSFPGSLCFPGGNLEVGEIAPTGLTREVFEETGIYVPEAAWEWVDRRTANEVPVEVYRVTFKQDVPPEVSLSYEHDAFEWHPASDVPHDAAPMTAKLAGDKVWEDRPVRWMWPLKGCVPLMPPDFGSFGSVRRHDIHTGVDLYCEVGTEVQAVEDGVVLSIEPFTGPGADSPWWNDTHAILIRGPSGVVTYGEVAPRVQVGDRLRAGDTVAVVETPVLKRFKGKPMVMLHIELMTTDAEGTVWWKLDEPRPVTLMDPTILLVDAANAAGGFSQFDLDTYDGIAFRPPEGFTSDADA